MDEKACFFTRLHLLNQIDDDDGEDEGVAGAEDFLGRAESKSEGSNRKAPNTIENLDSSHRKQGSSRTGCAQARENQNVRIYKPEMMAPPKGTPLIRHDRISRSLSFPNKLNQPKANDLFKPPALKKLPSAPPLVSSPSNMSTRKRIKKGSIQLVPEDRRIFKDLSFYFFPNNTHHGGRKKRIEKAQQYGARWIQNWSEGVTHVIMDEGLKHEELAKFLKEAISENVHVVNETFISDCIIWGTLLNPKEKRYQAKGAPSSIKEGVLRQPEESRPSLLRLEPEQTSRKRKLSPLRTPSRTPERNIEEPLQDTRRKKDNTIVLNSESFGYTDALTDAINQAKRLEHPFEDSDEEDSSRDDSSTFEPEGGHGSDEEGQRRQLSASNLASFSCMHRHDGSSKESNPNMHTIETLEKMASYYDTIKDPWRTFAYRRAISCLKKQSQKITTKEEAMRLPFVGHRLATKIEEIVLTNKLRRLEHALDDPAHKILQTFMGIYGVGVVQASRWVNSGFKTMADLQARAKLTENQKIGIAHYDDFLDRVTRAEVEQHGVFVSDALREIDPTFEVIIMGSYRRGAKDSGDIDLMITKPDTNIKVLRTVILDSLVPLLMKRGFLKAGLATTHRDTGSKWHGCSSLPGSTRWRRIDFLLVPWDEVGAALIYFTGNDLFNRSIRLLASKKGMRLNQHGLYKNVMRGRARVKVTDGELVEGRSEKKIFEILGVPWRPPHHRIC